MALCDVATAQLWETLRVGGGAELIRDAVRLVFRELIEAEAAEAIGAGRYERSEARANERDGRRARLLATQAGDVELSIPKLRRGSFMPSVIEPRRRIDRALHAVAVEAYVAGVSTRSAEDLAAALGAESGISKSEASRICAGLDETAEASRGRRRGRLGPRRRPARRRLPQSRPAHGRRQSRSARLRSIPQSPPARDLDPSTPSNASTRRSNERRDTASAARCRITRVHATGEIGEHWGR